VFCNQDVMAGLVWAEAITLLSSSSAAKMSLFM
jgi:hypothetical protein